MMKRRDILKGAGASLISSAIPSSAFAQTPRFTADVELKNFATTSAHIRTPAADTVLRSGSVRDIVHLLRSQPQVHPPQLYLPSERVKLFSRFSVGPNGEIGISPLVPLSNEKSGLPYQGSRVRDGVLTSALAAVEAPRRDVQPIKEGIAQGLGVAILSFAHLGEHANIPILSVTELTNADLHGTKATVAATVYENAQYKRLGKRTSAYLTGTIFNMHGRDALQKVVNEALSGSGEHVHPLVKRGMLFVPSPEMESVQLLAKGTNAIGALVMDKEDARAGVILQPIILRLYKNGEEEPPLTVFLMHGPDMMQYARKA